MTRWAFHTHSPGEPCTERPKGQGLELLGRANVVEKTRFAQSFGTAADGRGQGDVERVSNVLGPHGATEHPVDDLARVVI